MKDRISLALEGVGSGLFWILGGFTLIIFTAPVFWFGEALSDLRWHVGFMALLPAVPGVFLLPRRRLTFISLAVMGVVNVLPGLRVFVPPNDASFTTGDQLMTLEVHWGHAPTVALEERLAMSSVDLVFITGLDEVGRASLAERLVEYPYHEAWPPIIVDAGGETLPLEIDSTMLFSKHPLQDFTVAGFDSGAYLFETLLDLGDLPISLRCAVLPPPGPGNVAASRTALLKELDDRSWPERGILLSETASSDTSPAYSELLDTTGYVDSRRGFGRMATFSATLFGYKLPAMRIPSGYLMHGTEVATIKRRAYPLRVTKRDFARDKSVSDMPTRTVIETSLRIKSAAPQ